MLYSTSFFQKFEQEIKESPHTPGILRYRRSGQVLTEQQLVTDLGSFFQVLGEPTHVHFIRRRLQELSHTVGLFRFKNGSIGHIEFTSGIPERVELEWSGQQAIIEWDSARNGSWMSLGEIRTYRQPEVSEQSLESKWLEIAEKCLEQKVTT